MVHPRRAGERPLGVEGGRGGGAAGRRRRRRLLLGLRALRLQRARLRLQRLDVVEGDAPDLGAPTCVEDVLAAEKWAREHARGVIAGG